MSLREINVVSPPDISGKTPASMVVELAQQFHRLQVEFMHLNNYVVGLERKIEQMERRPR